MCAKVLFKTIRLMKQVKRFNPKSDVNVQMRSPEARCLAVNGAVGVLVYSNRFVCL